MSAPIRTAERRNDLLALRRQDLRNAREFGSQADVRAALRALKRLSQVAA